MHSEGTGRRRSIPYIVCDAFGLDTGQYSFAYVARWSEGEAELVRATAERVLGCAKQILECVGDSEESPGEQAS